MNDAPETSLQTADPAALQARLDELSELSDMLPLLSSFREHLDEEQKRHRRRMGTMLFFGTLLFLAMLAVPLIQSIVFIRETRDTHRRQQETQAEIARTLSTSIEQMSRAGERLQQALVELREPRPPSLDAMSPELTRQAALEDLLRQVDSALEQRQRALEQIRTGEPETEFLPE